MVEGALNKVSRRLQEVRRTYSFDGLEGTSAAHAVGTPVVQDIERWLEHGLAGGIREAPIVLLFIERRALDAHDEVRTIFESTRATTMALVNSERIHLAQLRDSIVAYLGVFPLFAVGLVLILFRKRAAEVAQKEAQVALADREEQYRRIFEATTDGLCIFSATRALMDVNPAACTIYGRAREDMLALGPKACFHEVSHAELERFIVAVESRQLAQAELQGVHADGSVFDAEIHGAPYLTHGEQHLLMSIRDVTKRKEAERILATAAQELENFAYVAAHDLKAPLRAMNGFSALLLEDYSNRLDDTGKQYLGLIRDGAVRMDRSIDNLLDYSRVGREGLVFERIDMDELFAEVLANLDAEARTLDAAIIIERPMPTIEGCRSMLEEVFRNLFDNALKFTAQGTAPQVRVTAVETGNDFEFCVLDNGIGIEEAYRESVFGIFERLHGDDQYHGTGIGLALVSKAVQLHRGAVRIDGNPHGGSAVHVRLPALQMLSAA